MFEEPFAEGISPIHRIDPRMRVVSAVLFSFAVALFYDPLTLLMALAVSVCLILISRADLKKVAKRLFFVNGFILLFWIILPLTYGGEKTPLWGPFAVSKTGILMAAVITLKSNAILIALIALISTMSFATLGHTLNRLKIPDKLVYLLLLTYRYIFVIEQEYGKVMRAIKIRGFTPRTSLHTYKTYAYVIGMLFIRAAERAERVYQAMRCRGFDGRFYTLAEFRTSLSSWLFMVFMTAVTLFLIAMEIFYHG